MAPLNNISGCVSFFGKLSHMIIHVFRTVQGPTSTGDLHDEYFKYIFESSHKPQNYKQHVVYIANADLAHRGSSYLSYSKTMASKTVSLFTFCQKMR